MPIMCMAALARSTHSVIPWHKTWHTTWAQRISIRFLSHFVFSLSFSLSLYLSPPFRISIYLCFHCFVTFCDNILLWHKMSLWRKIKGRKWISSLIYHKVKLLSKMLIHSFRNCILSSNNSLNSLNSMCVHIPRECNIRKQSTSHG